MLSCKILILEPEVIALAILLDIIENMRLVLAIIILLVLPVSSQALVLHGYASTYANDPVTGFVDGLDNNIPALPGASNDQPGIAVYRSDTLGGYWRVTAPNGITAVIKQTDKGPAPYTGATFDINAVAARLVFQYPQGDAFPTKEGRWRGVYLGKRTPSGYSTAGLEAYAPTAADVVAPMSPREYRHQLQITKKIRQQSERLAAKNFRKQLRHPPLPAITLPNVSQLPTL